MSHERPTSTLPAAGMQAMLATGFSDLTQGRFLLLQVKEAAAARAWLKELLKQNLVPAVENIQPPQDRRRQEAVAVAFSHAGLQAFEAEIDPDAPFPSIFSDGMGHADRAGALGDKNAAQWRWSDAAPPADSCRAQVHLVVSHYWSTQLVPPVGRRDLFSAAELSQGFHIVDTIEGDPGYFVGAGRTQEPFGFADGTSQPLVRGLDWRGERALREATDPRLKAALENNAVAPGEFVLGTTNQYNETAYAPTLKDWLASTPFAQGATYLAVRQIVQHVEVLQRFEQQHSPCAGDEPTLTEKMVGRRKSGVPLCPYDPAADNAFGFAITDPNGFGCPRGAHLRRANPRDTLGQDPELGWGNSRLHRLLRRGRSYLRNGERGMMFIALNADLDRQFAMVQQRWIANPRFGDLADQSDPLLGPAGRAFTLQDPTGGLRVENLPLFAEVVGGGYFLLPALDALDFLARDIPPRLEPS
jgi:porphyrinogen peroxidase